MSLTLANNWQIASNTPFRHNLYSCKLRGLINRLFSGFNKITIDVKIKESCIVS